MVLCGLIVLFILDVCLHGFVVYFIVDWLLFCCFCGCRLAV